MEKVAGTAELSRDGSLHGKAAAVQERVALLPDYNLPESESAGGNILSGLVGTGLVLVLCALGGGLMRLRRKSA